MLDFIKIRLFLTICLHSKVYDVYDVSMVYIASYIK